MDHLAKAVIAAFMFLELSGEDAVDEDSAVRVMESMTAELRKCGAAERKALEDAASAELTAQQAAHAPAETLEFLETFTSGLFEDE